MGELLFISSAVTTAVSRTKQRDANIRLHETKEAIQYNISTGFFDKLVIVDGSDTNVLTKIEIDSIKRRGIQVEQLKFQQPVECVNQLGQSYGEMLITNYMLANSQLVKEFGRFIKISGRYKFVNAPAVLPKLSKLNTFFINYHPFFTRNTHSFTNTILYKSSVQFFRDHLEDCGEECSKDVDGYLESVFFRRVMALPRTNLSIPYPRFQGTGGGTGKPLVERHVRKRQILSYLGLLAFTCDSKVNEKNFDN